MDAVEARRITSAAIDGPQITADLNTIEAKIRLSAERGENTITMSTDKFQSRTMIFSALAKLGYTVTVYGDQRNGGVLTISW